ncbi:hypothetical protein MSG28_015263 [Choristoneura fumiferana]|uniref:Uncharacterized protein n=1 Tax=Choristoneura fumiferana TaxID=7141 RepID=A0ACC0K9R9_CHOFU|nr:hypothetical protein MSG28_015263 [Choristoneura fumiferana]
MKATEKKRKIKKKPIDKSKKQQVAVVAQEIKFARLLSGNEKKTRDRVLRALKKWLLNCFEKNYEFKEDDFTRVWKGLFYAVWMSDKPLVQEDLCESIAGILDLFPPEQIQSAMLLARAGFKMLATEWFGIDQHRIDKFLMLVRRYLRGALRCVQRSGWSETACDHFAGMLAHKDGILALNTPLFARNAISMSLHVADCYLEEISKVSMGRVPPASLCVLLRPLVLYVCHGAAPPLAAAARRVLTDLMAHGDVQEDDEEVKSDQEEGEESGDEAQGDEEQSDENDSDDEITDGPLDPRAGHVDVVLQALPVPARQLADMLRAQLASAAGAGHRRARKCVALLEQFADGGHPLAAGGRPPPVLEAGPPLRPARAARTLRALEKKLVANGDELALRGLSRKHRKRLLARSRAGHSIVDEVPAAKRQTDKRTNANGDWQVEETEPDNKKKKRKQANKDNLEEPKIKKQKIETENNVKVKKDKAKKAKAEEVGNVKVVKVNGAPNVKVKSDNTKDGKVKSDKTKDVKVKRKLREKNVEEKQSKVKNSLKEKNEVKLKNDVKVKTQKDKSKQGKDGAKLVVNKIKKFQKQDKVNISLNGLNTPKKVKFELKNNSMQGALDYYKSVRQSPNIPFDSSKRPSKTNLKVSTPSPINPFFKKKMTRRASFAAQIVY